MKLLNGDCLELMKQIEDKSIDMILCDLPYGTTECKWDTIIPFDKLWEQYNRIIKDNGVIALFGSEPFSSYLRLSNIKEYKYDWIWDKRQPTGFVNAHVRPMKRHEIISIFSNGSATSTSCSMIYNPQGLKEYNKITSYTSRGYLGERESQEKRYIQKYTNYPNSILSFSKDKNKLHPTQKPVALLEYLIKTYTNEDMLVLDNTMGSGSTGVACVNTNRDFIGIELDVNYFNIAKKRIEEATNNKASELKLGA